ncbi:MAG: AMP-binding protein [Saprospiraceae bacterium]|nr:AMP-binding protein [Saprospiraceae bacterium]
MKNISYTSGISDCPLLGETITQNLKKTVEKYGNREALVVPHQNYRATYSEFWQQINIVAKSLVSYGIKKGDRVGIWAPNRFEWVLIQYASARIGAILVNINPAYKASGLEYALIQSGLKLLVMSKGFRQTDYTEILQQVKDNAKELENIIVIEKDWDKFLDSGKDIADNVIDEMESQLNFDDPINIQYTSGTTGQPKGATLSHHNILNNGFHVGERLKYTEKDRVCIPVPFYHCFGMVMGNLASTSHGACMVIPGEFFEPAQTLKVVQDEKCTSLYGVPTMFIAELELPDIDKYDFSHLRTGIMAGAPCPVETMKQVIQKMNMRDVAICYGMTETSPVSTMSFPDDPFDKRVTTVGKVMPFLEVKVVDPVSGDVLKLGEQGELCTRGYSVMLGYWDDPVTTGKNIDANKWMHTGDLAVMDEEGYLAITGRIKDLIIRGGENISPREIEEFLMQHDAITEIYVIAVPSQRYGEEVCAWVKIRQGYSVTEEELFTFCKGRIDTFKIPRYWKFVDSFPTTVTGKIRKVEMREISSKELNLEDFRLLKENKI